MFKLKIRIMYFNKYQSNYLIEFPFTKLAFNNYLIIYYSFCIVNRYQNKYGNIRI